MFANQFNLCPKISCTTNYCAKHVVSELGRETKSELCVCTENFPPIFRPTQIILYIFVAHAYA